MLLLILAKTGIQSEMGFLSPRSPSYLSGFACDSIDFFNGDL